METNGSEKRLDFILSLILLACLAALLGFGVILGVVYYELSQYAEAAFAWIGTK